MQAFTAIRFIRSGEVYAHDMTADDVPGFVPWRIDLDYLSAQIAPIKPLITQLNFTTDKTHWGAAFRFGQVRIGEADFRCIAQAMRCNDLPQLPARMPAKHLSPSALLVQPTLF